MNIFELAVLEVEREGKIENKKVVNLIFDRAIRIRKYMDMQNKNQAVADSRSKKK